MAKLTDETVRQAQEMAKLGLPRETIANVLGVTSRAMRNWCSIAESHIDEDETPLTEYIERCIRFFHALKKGYGQAEQKLVTLMTKCGENGQWGAIKFLLLHNPEFRKRWGKDITSEEAMKIVAKSLLAGDEDITKALRAAVAEASNQPSV